MSKFVLILGCYNSALIWLNVSILGVFLALIFSFSSL